MSDRAPSSRAAAAARALDDYVAKVVAAAPPLSDAQRQRLAELLRPARSSINAA
ncbi:hypothetical protein P5V43_05425 [Mycobacteroides abscessus subsp. bolletii]|uniref:hypothetical protein n=1 Tax=Mycobacteroides abscessus TaxID=36809 RepID=UPI00266BD760|nr:hypothetical protein [Mycobacteroides abscessus]MDO3126539.1 hypothetical protein [Mycobacteroides abscessus subsp. bolletii]